MKRKEKILRIRPFNMANFSSGAGFLASYSLISAFFVIPIMFAVWCGLASSLRKAKGQIDHIVLIRRLDRIFLPICILACVLVFALFSQGMFSYFGRSGPEFNHIVTAVWISAFPTLGMYIAMRLAVAIIKETANLTISNLIAHAFIAGISLGVIGVIVALIIAESPAFFALLAVATLFAACIWLFVKGLFK